MNFINVGAGNTAASYEADSGDTYTEAFDYMMADIDDQYSHHFSLNTEGQEKEIMEKENLKEIISISIMKQKLLMILRIMFQVLTMDITLEKNMSFVMFKQ